MGKINFFEKIFSLLLTPLSWVWETIYRVRRFLYKNDILKSNDFMVPIISVGNLTFGGTGKTPFVLWLCEYLASKNKKTMILMRGYKGKYEHSSALIKANRKLGHNPNMYGDEALMLIKRLRDTSIVVGKNRAQNLEYYFSSEKPDVVVLDDGHQHLSLERKLNIVLFDALMPIKKYKTPPRGYLREGLTALKDADLVIINRSDLVSITELSGLKKMIRPFLNKEVPICEMGYKVDGLFDINSQKSDRIDDLRGQRVVCVAGIASPVSFFKMIELLGCEIVQKIIYPDHYAYSKEDVKYIVEQSKTHDALVITTEKDIIKLKRLEGSEQFFFLGVGIYFSRGEHFVLDAISRTIKS